MKRLLLFCAFLIPALAVAQVPHQPVPPRDSVTVSGEGKFEAAPDTALIQFNVGAQEPELKAAYDRANRAAEQIRQTLRANGIDPKAAEIGFFQVSPVYDWKNPKRKLVAYRVSSAISLKLKDFSKVGPLAASFADMDVSESQNISYLLDNMEEAKVKAIRDAMRNSRSSAAAVAESGARTLGEMLRATVDSYEMPRPMPMMKAQMANERTAAPTAEFSPEKITVTVRVTTEYALK